MGKIQLNAIDFTGVDTNNQHVVIWSGGADSTLLLKRVAEKYGTSDKPVLALSLDHHAIGEQKTKIERIVRKTILATLHAQGLNIIHTNIKVEGENVQRYTGGGAIQAFLWLTHLMLYIPSRANVYIGYLYDDSFWHYKEEFIKMAHWSSSIADKPINIRMPLQGLTKADVLEMIHTEGLYDDIWYCERPTDDLKSCGGECNACKTHTMALVKLAYEASRNGDISWAKNKLPQEISIKTKKRDKSTITTTTIS